MVAFSLFPGDTVVLFVLLGITVGALAGRLAGGIRVAFFLFSLVLALSLGHLLAGLGLFAKMTELIGFKNPLWLLLIPKILATALLMLVSVAVLESVHHKIYLHYKYKHKNDLNTDDFDTWEYLNDIWGLTLGLAAGMVCLIVLFSWLHAPGYLLLQTRPAESTGDKENHAKGYGEKFDPWGHRLLRRVCADMHALRLGAIAAKLGPAEPRYYAVADTIGYIYHNYGRDTDIPSATLGLERERFHQRVFFYPGISPVLRQKEIYSLTTNSAFMKLWRDKTNFHQITSHSKVVPLLHAALRNDDNNTVSSEFINHLAKLNLQDYQKFLHTGVSGVYSADNPDQAAVVGSWQLAVDQTYESLRRHYPQSRMPNPPLAVHKFLINAARRDFSQPDKVPVREHDWILTFTKDNQAYSVGRFFPTGPLFVVNKSVAAFTNPTFDIHDTKALRARGSWNASATGQGEFAADLRMNTPPFSTVRVFIAQHIVPTDAGDHLIIRFPKYNNEEYVFRRYEF
jgi:hypothetical protein